MARFELSLEIKQRWPDLLVMMVTAMDVERRQRASDLGAFRFRTSRVDVDRLKAQLRELPGAAVAAFCHKTVVRKITLNLPRWPAKRGRWLRTAIRGENRFVVDSPYPRDDRQDQKAD